MVPLVFIYFTFCLMKTMIAGDIDLLNVSFDGESAPDRISARAGLKELQKIAPSRMSVDLNFDVSDFIFVFRAKFAVNLQMESCRN